ncbi:tetratricopeptide repeat protein [bacterium]|nr:tetratricopeptide repeat protein [bacterium]
MSNKTEKLKTRIAQETDVKKKTDLYKKLGNLLLVDQEKYDQSLDYYLEARTLYESIGFQDGVADILNNVGLVYGRLGNVDTAHKYFKESLESKKKLGLQQELCYANTINNIGIMLCEKKDFEKAKKYFQQSLGIMKKKNDKRIEYANTLCNTGVTYLKLNDLNSASDCFSQALHVYKSNEDKNGILTIHILRGQLLIDEKDYESAYISLIKGLNLAEEIGNTRRKRETYKILVRLFEVQDDFKKALEYLYLHDIESQTIFNDDLQSKIAALDAGYKLSERKQNAEITRIKNIELETLNQELKKEIFEHKKVEASLKVSQRALEKQNTKLRQLSHAVEQSASTVVITDKERTEGQ